MTDHLAPDPDPKAVRRCKCEFSSGGVQSKRCQFHEGRRRSAERYEYVRCLNVPQFKALFDANLRGEGTFDDLVDAALRGAPNLNGNA